MAKVFIVNKSAHDFSEAKQYGDIIFMTEGSMNRYACNDMHRKFSEKLKSSKSNDYLVLCALNIMNSIACSVFVHKHGKLNLLLFNEGRYIKRNLIF